MSEFNRWLSKRNPRYFMEQERTPVPPAPAEDAFEAAKKRRAELKRKRDADAAGQPQPPMGQNPPAPVEDAFEAAKKRRAELKRQRDAAFAAAKQQPPTVQPPTVQPPTVQPPTVQQSVGGLKDFINNKEQENKQGGTSQPPTMQPPPSPPAAQKTTQTKDDDDEPTDEEFEKMDWVALANFYRGYPEKLYSAFIKKIQLKGGLEEVLKDNNSIYWIAKKQVYNFKEKIISSDEAKKLLSTRKDLTNDTRGYLRKIAPDVGGPLDEDIKKTDISDLVEEYGDDKEKLYYAFTRKIQLQGFDEAVKDEYDVRYIFNRQKGIFQDIKNAKMIITPDIAQKLLERIKFSDFKFKSELRRFARTGAYE